ncbi:MAG TPA: MBL fold metallo-hydrolase [Polyangia bacterium]|jgi:phosphoribosyl 1,2-cyclic phosphodiesterase
MKVKFWGVRGSIPVPGKQTNRYGGNTSCVEVQAEDGPRIIIDAGTGVRRLGKELMHEEFGRGEGVAHLLISHTHWDHIQGMPFFAPLYQSGNRFYVYARQRDDVHLRAVFQSQTEDPYFPVPFDAVKADVAFRELIEGARFEIGPVKVSCTRLNHPWIAIAYRLDYNGASVCYVTDTAPFRDVLLENEFIAEPPRLGAPLAPATAAKLRKMQESLVRLCEGADLVIYDTMFTPEEYARQPHWGHSCPDDAIEICRAAGARSLALYHHAPERGDDEVDAIVSQYRKQAGRLDVWAAAEGREIKVGR